jgi:hypothetical protein
MECVTGAKKDHSSFAPLPGFRLCDGPVQPYNRRHAPGTAPALAFIHLESIGTWPERDRIVEIAVLKIYPDGREEFRCKRVNPGVPILPDATAIVRAALRGELRAARRRTLRLRRVRGAPFMEQVSLATSDRVHAHRTLQDSDWEIWLRSARPRPQPSADAAGCRD